MLPSQGTDYTKAKTVIVYNVTMTLANTEYSQALPANTRKLSFQCRTGYDIRFAFTTGKVAGSVSPFATIKSGGAYDEKDLNLTGETLYLASSQADVIIEVVCYV